MTRAIAQFLLLLSSLVIGSARADEFCLPLPDSKAVTGVVEYPAQPTQTVAILLPGTHTTDRDGAQANPSGGEGIYAALARALREQGLAVARLDPPFIVRSGTAGCDRKNAAADFSLVTERQAFAVAANYLRRSGNQGRFRRVVFVGHSQGAFIGAQILAKQPALADEFYISGMTLGPLNQMTRQMVVNMRLDALAAVMESRPGSCITNDEMVRHRHELEMLLRPVQRWFAPDGRWCRGKLDRLVARFLTQIAEGERVAKECKPSVGKSSIGEIGNSCEELQLFFSTESVADLLLRYPGRVGVALGIHDSHLMLGLEGARFREFAQQGKAPRNMILLDMGHVFGDHPYLGPANKDVLREFATFIAKKNDEVVHEPPHLNARTTAAATSSRPSPASARRNPCRRRRT